MWTLGTAPLGPPFELIDLHVDHLGSMRISTDELGDIVAQHDYFPFGGEVAPMYDDSSKRFTGHERDLETGLDYMFARYYGAHLGRFLSVDPAGALSKSRRMPARWNRYSYTLSNPLRFIDPDGEDEIAFGSRTFEIYPGDVFVVQQRGGGLHTATYVGGGKANEIRVVDNTAARNEKVSEKMKATRRPDNTGNKHNPHDLLAPVNGAASPYSPESGATAVGVVPAETPSTTSAVEEAAAATDMYYMDPDSADPQQCSDFTDALDEELGTGIDADESKGTEGYKEKIDPSREKTSSSGGS